MQAFIKRAEELQSAIEGALENLQVMTKQAKLSELDESLASR